MCTTTTRLQILPDAGENERELKDFKFSSLLSSICSKHDNEGVKKEKNCKTEMALFISRDLYLLAASLATLLALKKKKVTNA